jgi:O-antigen/teichoic acid export membrane protein
MIQIAASIPSYIRTAFSAWIAKGIIVVSKLIMIPLLIDYLGMDSYAAFVLLASLEGWFLLCDFGIAISLQNYISEYKTQNKAITPLLKAAAGLSLTAFISGLLFIFFIKTWTADFLLGKILQDPLLSESVFIATACLFLIGTLGTVGTRVYYALHQGAKVHAGQALGSLISLISLLCLVKGYEGHNKLLYSLLLSVGLPSVVSFRCWIKAFLCFHWPRGWDWALVKMILKRAKDFWIFSCLAAFVLLIDSFVISRTLCSEEIVEYHFLYKTFGTVAFIFTAIIQGLWPTCSELMITGYFDRLRAKIQKYCTIGLIMILSFTLILWAFSAEVRSLFLGKNSDIIIPISTILLFGLYHCIRVVTDMYAMVLQSVSHLKIFLYLVPIQACISISGQYFLSKAYGINGILGGLILSYLLTVSWALPLRFKKIQKIRAARSLQV